jgi:hypothetical protein
VWLPAGGCGQPSLQYWRVGSGAGESAGKGPLDSGGRGGGPQVNGECYRAREQQREAHIRRNGGGESHQHGGQRLGVHFARNLNKEVAADYM